MKDMPGLVQLFKQNGYRITPQRQHIFKILQGRSNHPSAEEIYREAARDMNSLSVQTVYRTLAELVDLGELDSLDLGTGMLRYDPNVSAPHHHLVCRSCGQVSDLYIDMGPLNLPDELKHGFQVDSSEVVFRGICKDCMDDRPPGASYQHTANLQHYRGRPHKPVVTKKDTNQETKEVS
jgi:Fe2+ or Zn2+ uptake regulation protein